MKKLLFSVVESELEPEQWVDQGVVVRAGRQAAWRVGTVWRGLAGSHLKDHGALVPPE